MNTENTYKKQAFNVGQLTVIVILFLVLSLFTFLGLAPLHLVSQQTNLEKKATDIKQTIEQNSFSGTNKVLQTLQNNNEIKKALLSNTYKEEVLIICNLTRDILNASLVYLMDTTGTVVSSTSYLTKEGIKLNLTGNNYKFRPYFIEALNGNSIIYPAVGVTTGKRGIYCSTPVYNSSKKHIIGVIVLKLDVNQIDEELKKYDQQVILMSPEQIVFATNNEDWLYAVPKEKYESIKANVKKSMRFNEDEITSLPFDFNTDKFTLNNTTYLLENKTIAASSWSILVLEPKNPNYPINKKLLKIVIVTIFIFIILSVIILGLLYIIKRKKIAELALRRNKESLKTTLYSIGEGVIAVDTDGNILQINPVAAELTEIEISAAIGTPISEVFHALDPKTNEPDEHIINAINNGKTSTSNELILQSATNKKYDIFILVNPLKDIDGNLLGMVLIFRDITHENETKLRLKNQYQQIKEALKKAEESDHLKTAFLQNISHEIRTPLNGIVGFSELLSTSEFNKEIIEEYRNHIITNANYLLEIIHDVIEISKLETNQIEITKEKFDLNKVCEDVYSRYHIIHKADKNLELKLKLPEQNKSIVIDSDLNKVTKIFHILLDNAYKYTNTGTISFGFIVEKNKIQCYVKDTGIGVPNNLHKDIFKNFSQIPNNKKQQVQKGIGVGLAIAHHYALLLGGSIWLESENEKGTVFYFTLPIK